MQAIERARRDLEACYRAGVAAVEGGDVVRRWLERRGAPEECALVAVGKASQAMARGAAEVLGERLAGGLVIGKRGHLDPALLASLGLEGIVGGHPLPDAGSLEAGRRLLRFLAGLPPGRPLLLLISGGASALVEVPQPGIDLALLARINRWLLASGLPIQAMNAVRRRVSRIKGGGLLAFLGVRPVTALLVSDVRGDDPAVIGSGLVAPGPPLDPALEARLPDWLRRALPAPAAGVAGVNEPEVHIVATLADACRAAVAEGERLGYPVQRHRAPISGQAETVGRRLALELADALPGIQVWGGEPTVVLPPDPGRGGRCQQLALAAATVFEGREDLCLLAAGTDGSDGPGEDTGAIVDGGTLGRARRHGFDPAEALGRADAGSLLAASGDLLRTGPTGTNVTDLMIGLRLESKGGDNERDW